MSISIELAFKSFFSKKYNKLQFLSFIIIGLIASFCQIHLNNLFEIFETGTVTQINCILAVICYSIYLFASLYIFGFISLTNYNEIHSKEAVFPNFTDFPLIIVNGFRLITGSILLAILFLIPFYIIQFIIIAFNFNTLKIITIPLVIIYFIYFIFKILIPLTLMFYSNLEFKSLFKFNKINSFMDKRKGNYKQYIEKQLIIIILYLIVISFLYLYKLLFDGEIITETIISTVAYVFIPIITNINAQYINSIKQRHRLEKK